MAYKFNTSYGTKTLGARQEGFWDDYKKSLKTSLEANKAAEEKLRLTDISNRQEMFKTINSLGNLSNDKAFNDGIRDMMFGYADEYAQVKDGLNRGTVDAGEGTAFIAQADGFLNLFQEFAVSAKAVETQINEMGGIEQGGVGSAIMGGKINDIKTLNMIHEMFQNPSDLEVVRESNGMYLKRKTANEDGSYDTINTQQFVDAVGEGKNLAEAIPDVGVIATDAFKAIDSAGISGYKVDKKFANGVMGVGYDRAKLEAAYKTTNPWQSRIDNHIQANGIWEYLEHLPDYKDIMKADPNYNEGIWIGNEIDKEGELTQGALDQQEFLKTLLTKFSIDRSIPADDFVQSGYAQPKSTPSTTSKKGKQTDKERLTNQALVAAEKNNRIAQQIIDDKYAKLKDGSDFATGTFTREQMIANALNSNATKYNIDAFYDVNEDGKLVLDEELVSYDNNIQGITGLLNSVSGFEDADVLTEMNNKKFPKVSFEIKDGNIRVVGGEKVEEEVKAINNASEVASAAVGDIVSYKGKNYKVVDSNGKNMLQPF
tara:strand:- start:200 stop:1825 length:1626 start_codon:yes stop_codon:yes gene_type:complete